MPKVQGFNEQGHAISFSEDDQELADMRKDLERTLANIKTASPDSYPSYKKKYDFALLYVQTLRREAIDNAYTTEGKNDVNAQYENNKYLLSLIGGELNRLMPLYTAYKAAHPSMLTTLKNKFSKPVSSGFVHSTRHTVVSVILLLLMIALIVLSMTVLKHHHEAKIASFVAAGVMLLGALYSLDVPMRFLR